MAPNNECNCHANGFNHWKFEKLINKYDLGIRVLFDRSSAPEPRLMLYVSIWQVINDTSELKGSIPVNLSRSSWAARKGIDAVMATEELRASNNDLNSEPAHVLLNYMEREIRLRLEEYERSGNLNLRPNSI